MTDEVKHNVFHGVEIKKGPGILTFDFVRFGFSDRKKAGGVSPHRHNDYELLIADEGLYGCSVNDAWMDLEPGQGVIVKPGDEHEDRFGGPVRYFSFAFYIRATGFDPGQASVFPADSPPQSQQFETGVDLHRKMFSQYETAQEVSGDFLGPLQDSLLSLFFWNVIRTFNPEVLNPSFYRISQSQSFPNQLHRMFRSRIHTQMTVEEMAGEMYMSESAFSHTCKEVLGISPYKAFMKVKMERARHFLEDSSWSMKEISNELGLADQYTFSRTFKNHYGVSPANWRKGEGGK